MMSSELIHRTETAEDETHNKPTSDSPFPCNSQRKHTNPIRDMLRKRGGRSPSWREAGDEVGGAGVDGGDAHSGEAGAACQALGGGRVALLVAGEDVADCGGAREPRWISINAPPVVTPSRSRTLTRMPEPVRGSPGWRRVAAEGVWGFGRSGSLRF